MSRYILVVDDNPSDLILTSVYVEKETAIPVKVDNGFSAIEKLSEYEFKLIIVDLQMPKMSGIELIKRIRRIEKYKKTPILVTSARQESKDVKQAVQAGANDYLVKPIDAQVFEEKFKRLVGNQIAWTEYPWPQNLPDAQAFVKTPVQVVSISEVGATLKDQKSWPVGETFEISAQLLTLQGIDSLVVRTLESQKVDQYFVIKVSFIGLTETTRMKIRLICRSLWSETNKENPKGGSL